MILQSFLQLLFVQSLPSSINQYACILSMLFQVLCQLKVFGFFFIFYNIPFSLKQYLLKLNMIIQHKDSQEQIEETAEDVQFNDVKEGQQELRRKISQAENYIKKNVQNKQIILFVGQPQAGKTKIVKALIQTLIEEGLLQISTQDTNICAQDMPFTITPINQNVSICDFKGFGYTQNLHQELLICWSIMMAMRESRNFKIVIVCSESLFTEPKYIRLTKMVKEVTKAFSQPVSNCLFLWITMANLFQDEQQIKQILSTILKLNTSEKEIQTENWIINELHIEISRFMKKKQKKIMVRRQILGKLMQFGSANHKEYLESGTHIFLSDSAKQQIMNILHTIECKREKKQKHVSRLKFNKVQLMEVKMKIFSRQIDYKQVQKCLAGQACEQLVRDLNNIKASRFYQCKKIIFETLQKMRVLNYIKPLFPKDEDQKRLEIIKCISEGLEQNIDKIIRMEENYLATISEVGSAYACFLK